MGVLRNRIGLLEDRFFATVFLGSGLLFVAMLFAAVSVARGLLDTFAAGLPDQSETYRLGRGMAYTLMNTFGTRMAAVFMFVTSTIGLRTAVLARWVSFVGFALGLVLLLVITEFAWIALVFPLWVLLVSTYILRFRLPKGTLEGPECGAVFATRWGRWLEDAPGQTKLPIVRSVLARCSSTSCWPPPSMQLRGAGKKWVRPRRDVGFPMLRSQWNQKYHPSARRTRSRVLVVTYLVTAMDWRNWPRC